MNCSWHDGDAILCEEQNDASHPSSSMSQSELTFQSAADTACDLRAMMWHLQTRGATLAGVIVSSTSI